MASAYAGSNPAPSTIKMNPNPSDHNFYEFILIFRVMLKTANKTNHYTLDKQDSKPMSAINESEKKRF